MKKGTKVWYYKTARSGGGAVNFAAEGVFLGIKDNMATVSRPHKSGNGQSSSAYFTKPLYTVFATKEELDDAAVSGVRVWVANNEKMNVVEARYDITTNETRHAGELIYPHRRTCSVSATLEEALKYLEDSLLVTLKERAASVRRYEENLKDVKDQHKETQLTLQLVRARQKGKNRLLSFKPKPKRKKPDQEWED
ncbi:MAG: hypothetical protein ACTS8S_00940 [Giesbergeria sp.]